MKKYTLVVINYEEFVNELALVVKEPTKDEFYTLYVFSKKGEYYFTEEDFKEVDFKKITVKYN